MSTQPDAAFIRENNVFEFFIFYGTFPGKFQLLDSVSLSHNLTVQGSGLSPSDFVSCSLNRP